MNYQQLQDKLAGLAHRADLAAVIPDFININARTWLNMRLQLELEPLVLPDDTNPTLTDYPLLYVYAGMRALYEHTNEGDNARHYDQALEREADRYYITRPGTTPLVITPVEEEP